MISELSSGLCSWMSFQVISWLLTKLSWLRSLLRCWFSRWLSSWMFY